MIQNKIRIFKPAKAPDKVLLNVKKYNATSAHLVLIGGTIDETHLFIQELMKPNINPFRDGNRITVEFREFKDGKNGTTKSFSFYGHSSPQDIINFLEQELSSGTGDEIPESECMPMKVTPCSNENDNDDYDDSPI